MYGMTNYEKLFSDELINWMIYEAGLDHSKCQISVYYKYKLYCSKLIVLYYVDESLYWYTYE